MFLDLDSNLGSLNPQLVLSLRLSLEFSEGRGQLPTGLLWPEVGLWLHRPPPICVQ